LVAGAADAAKEEAAVQINMLSRQLTAVQAQAAAAEKVRGAAVVQLCIVQTAGDAPCNRRLAYHEAA
jgi:hypothetical protein